MGLIKIVAVCFALLAAVSGATDQPQPQISKSENRVIYLYVGGYSGKSSQGIYVSRFDQQTGTLSPPELAAVADRASFLAFHPNKKFLYAIDEVSEAGGRRAGAIDAFSIDHETGKLVRLNHQSTKGDGACFVAVDPAGKNALVANYNSGSVAVVPIDDDGRLKSPSAFDQHEGKGPDPKRQDGPHAHSFYPDPTGRFALSCDLGLDKVFVYKLDTETGAIAASDPPFATVPPGAGARHLAFDPSGTHVYVVNEMGASVTTFEWDSKLGTLKAIDTVSIVPPDYSALKWAAEVMVHPSGRFLYASNRAHDTIALLTIDPATARLTMRNWTSTQGKTPRNFTIDPTGKFLVVSNQESKSVVVFRIDPSTGDLAPTGSKIEVGSPTCVRFLSLP